MKYLFLLALLASCAELQKNTNVNMMAEAETVRVLEADAPTGSCTVVTTVRGEDNLMNLGKDTAVANMKKYAEGKGANAIFVKECKETKTAISTITSCKGIAYKCP